MSVYESAGPGAGIPPRYPAAEQPKASVSPEVAQLLARIAELERQLAERELDAARYRAFMGDVIAGANCEDLTPEQIAIAEALSFGAPGERITLERVNDAIDAAQSAKERM